MLLFVYGSLKRGCHNHAEMAGQRFVGPARTAPGFRLFDVGGYPGLVPWADDREGVTGELWDVDAAGLARLDAFEGVGEGLYTRVTLPLQIPANPGSAQAYLYPHSIAGRREVGASWTE